MMMKKIKLALKAFSVIDNWWDYYLDYFGLKRGVMTLKIGGNKINIRAGTNDKRIVTEVALVEPYFPKDLKLPEECTIVDLGAHLGLFSILASSKFGCKQIYAVEPSEENYKLLVQQVSMNESPVTPLRLAISDKKGYVNLSKGENTARFSTVRKEGHGSEKVKSIILKELFSKYKINKCDLLKIDVEGAEYPIFYSTPKEVFKKIDRIILSLHDDVKDQKPDEMIFFLKKQGFKINPHITDVVFAYKE